MVGDSNAFPVAVMETALASGGNDDVEREIDVRAGLGLFASEHELRQLLAIARQIDVRPGAVLYEAGTTVTRIFQITRGEVELRSPGRPSWRVTTRGTMGFLDFMRGRAHSRTAVAVTQSRILELDGNDYREYMEDNFEVAHQIMATLADRVVVEILASAAPAPMIESHPAPLALPRSYADVEVSLVDRMVLLQGVAAFEKSTVQALANLAQSARELRYAAGEVVVEAGQRTDVVSILVDGEMELAHPTSGLRVKRLPVDLLAGPAELAITPRALRVTATMDSVVLQLDREELLDRVEEHFELSRSMFSYIAEQQEIVNDAIAAAGRAI